jgi:hypothetical protein
MTTGEAGAVDAAQKQGTPHSDVRKIEFKKKNGGFPKP